MFAHCVDATIAQSWGLHRSKILSVCDNKAVLRRLAHQHRMDRIQAHKASDTDLYLLYKAWLAKGIVGCRHAWVKGHQDKRKRLEDLPAMARLNIEVDHLTRTAYKRADCDRTVLDVPVFCEEQYAVFVESGKVVSAVRPAVLRQCGLAGLWAYQEEKHGLGSGVYESIDWDSLHGFLRGENPQHRAQYVKCQNGWLPTQAFLFKQGRAENDASPLCGEAGEDADHLFECNSHALRACRLDEVLRVVHYLRLAGTATEIINCWAAQLSAMFGLDFTPYYTHDTKEHRQVEAAVAIARRHQTLLTWKGFLQGRWSKEWAKVQRLSERLCGRQLGSSFRKPWVARAIELVCEIMPTLWRRRCEKVHGKTHAEKTHAEKVAKEREGCTQKLGSFTKTCRICCQGMRRWRIPL